MISLYSTWWIKPENEKKIEPVLHQLAQEVKENEKGTLMYLVHKPLYDYPTPKAGEKQIQSEPAVRPGTLVFVEKYESWQAFEDHLYGPYFTKFVAEYKDLFVPNNDGNPFVQVVFMEEITGFIK
jgi:quinol monooxygenase YgiN